ncbi:recombinase family protein [Rhodococcus zopfii]|uniref:recombinase family protein n=1 Tax=Rhodococcus zopfii TaxID=43772 RepID=UPI003528EC68
MRAVIYCRVSSDRSGRARSVTEQEADCREVCSREGWSVAEVLVDNDISASRFSNKERPAYEQLNEILQEGDVLVTWEASRSTRDLRQYVQLRDLCAERNVKWCYSGTVYDLTDGTDLLRTGLDALLSENEVFKTRERILRTVRASAAEGRPHGKIPFGYRGVYNSSTGELEGRVPDEVEAPIVREVAKRLLGGESARAIARDLDARGIRTPGTSERWRPGYLARMVTGPVYIGMRTHHGELTKGTWEPILDETDHVILRALMNDPKRLRHRGVAPKWLLTGIARCGVCNAPVRRVKDGEFQFYSCTESRCVARTMEFVDDLVGLAIVTRLSEPDILEQLRPTPADAGLRDELEELEARLSTAADMFAVGEIGRPQLARIEAQLRPRIDTVRDRLRPKGLNPVVVEMAGPDAEARWNSAPVDKKRRLVASLVDVTILKTKRRRDPAGVSVSFAK